MFEYINFRDRTRSADIGALFPGWGGEERLAVFSPHDDDGVIGAGYAIQAAQACGAQAFLFIFCNGDCGYSSPGEKDGIVDVRRRETEECYRALGVPPENIIRFDLPDFSTWQYLGYRMRDGRTGVFPEIVSLIRSLHITRVLLPNGYREHFDHQGVFMMGAYDAVQAGDPILADVGTPQAVKSTLVYSVWADFDPEDALLAGEGAIRANRAILAPAQAEKSVADALAQFRSQGRIIEGLVRSRAERRAGEGYMELYQSIDPRPKLRYEPYAERIRNLNREG